MISIVSCSRSPEVVQQLSRNVAATIGVPFEIVAVDNSTNKYGICAAYNEGASRSKYDLLCFAHEDIEFQTQNWGEIVTDIFRDETIGVLGVAGGTQQIDAPAGWMGGGQRCVFMNVMHDIKDEKGPTLDWNNPSDAQVIDVACLDGVWICTRRSVWEQVRFDEQAFPGFHFYDVDFCTRAFRLCRICVTFDVLIKHFSRGSFNDVWYATALQYYRKRRAYLPFGTPPAPAEAMATLSLNTLRQFTSDYIDRRISYADSLFLVWESINRSRFKRESWWLARKLAQSLIK